MIMPTDDRTAKARIRDAAIVVIAEHGVADTTARKIAEVADVSPGLVIHHFGSMEGLRAACDEYVAADDSPATSTRPSPKVPNLDVPGVASTTRQVGPLMRYLAQVLGLTTLDAVGKLVDELVADAEGYIQQGVAAGMVRAHRRPARHEPWS